MAHMVRGETIADVGSDHAYLPIWLYLNKKIKKAYALDISQNCVNKIKTNLKKYNIDEKIIIPVLSDGLSCFKSENDTYNFSELTDIIIAGMGGENISEIIGGAEIENIKDINLILQPNSKAEFLREFLYRNKFDITEEIITEEGGRIYNIINAAFTGKTYAPTPMDIAIGKNLKHSGYLKKIIKRLDSITEDLDKLPKENNEKYNVKTIFGYYDDIQKLITELKNYDKSC